MGVILRVIMVKSMIMNIVTLFVLLENSYGEKDFGSLLIVNSKIMNVLSFCQL